MDALPSRICAALTRLIPCLCAGYGTADPATQAFQVTLEHPDLRYSSEDLAYLATHLEELPFIDLPQSLQAHLARSPPSRETPARKSTDAMTHRQFRELGVYREVFRSKSIEYLLVLPTLRLGTRWIGGFGLQRDTRDFSERDRAVLEAIRPHLLRFFECAALFDIIAREARPDTGLLVLDSDGRPTVSSAEAERWLRALGPAPAGQLPARVAAHVREHRDALAPVPPLHFHQDGAALTVRFVPGIAGGDSGVLLLRRSQDVRAPEPGPLRPREAEVLRWVAEGKSNIEIAIILGCSAFTVRNHLQRIFETLGVESRTAAAAWWHRRSAMPDLWPRPSRSGAPPG